MPFLPGNYAAVATVKQTKGQNGIIFLKWVSVFCSLWVPIIRQRTYFVLDSNYDCIYNSNQIQRFNFRTDFFYCGDKNVLNPVS